MSDTRPESTGGVSVNSTNKASQNPTNIVVHRTVDGTISVCLRTPRRDGEPRHPDTPSLGDVDPNNVPRVPADRRYF